MGETRRQQMHGEAHFHYVSEGYDESQGMLDTSLQFSAELLSFGKFRRG